MPGVRLEWDGKTAEVPRLRLPLQVVETVNASRADRGTLSYDKEPDDGWRNKLIWGDNLHVLASLADELAGQVGLIYIDPPFDSRQDYKVRIAVGDGGDAADQDLAKLSSIHVRAGEPRGLQQAHTAITAAGKLTSVRTPGDSNPSWPRWRPAVAPMPSSWHGWPARWPRPGPSAEGSTLSGW